MHPAPHQSADAPTSDELLVEHYPLARTIAARMLKRMPPGTDLDELVSIAVVGLMDACSRFDPSRGVAFRTFAKHRMHGAILDAMRSEDWIPRSVRDRVKAVERTSETLRNELGRDATTGEVADRLGVDADAVRAARSTDLRQMASLDAPFDEDGGRLLDCLPGAAEGADVLVEEQELRQHLYEALAKLPAREQVAIERFYLSGVPLKEIGTELGVSDSRVCQLCSQGVKRLRRILAPVVR